jgi:hypothetical protein
MYVIIATHMTTPKAVLIAVLFQITQTHRVFDFLQDLHIPLSFHCSLLMILKVNH